MSYPLCYYESSLDRALKFLHAKPHFSLSVVKAHLLLILGPRHGILLLASEVE